MIIIIILVSIQISILWHRFFLDNSHLVPTKGGIYKEATIGRVKNLNPLAPNPTIFEQDLQALIFAGLQKYNPVSGEIENALADLSLSEDLRTYQLKLKTNARFQDGVPVTVRDVVFTYDKIIKDPDFENKDLKEIFEYVELKVIDGQTIAFTIPEPNVFFRSLLITPILPEKYFASAFADLETDAEFENEGVYAITNEDYHFNRNPIGAGPFQFQQIVPQKDGVFKIFLEKNPYYYNGEPQIDQIVFYVYPNLESLKLHSVQERPHLFSQIPYVDISSLLQEDHPIFYVQKDFVLPRFTGIFFNTDSFPFMSNYAFRKSLLTSFPKEKIIEDGWKIINGPFFFRGIETNIYEKNYTMSRNILRDNGFPYNSDDETRTYGKDGEPIELTMIAPLEPAVYSRFASKLKQTWEKELSINIDLQVLDMTEFHEALRTRNYDMVIYGQDFTTTFDPTLIWHNSFVNHQNLSNLTVDEVDFLIDEIRSADTSDNFRQLSNKLDEIIPAIIFATPKYSYLRHQDLKGFDESFGQIRKYADRFFDVERWYFEEQLDWDVQKIGPNQLKILSFIEWLLTSDPDTTDGKNEEISITN